MSNCLDPGQDVRSVSKLLATVISRRANSLLASKELSDHAKGHNSVRDSQESLSCVLEQEILSNALYWFNPGNHPNMTEILLTGM